MAEIGLTAGLAELAANVGTLSFAPEAIAAARRAFIDTLGVTLAGWREPDTGAST